MIGQRVVEFTKRQQESHTVLLRTLLFQLLFHYEEAQYVPWQVPRKVKGRVKQNSFVSGAVRKSCHCALTSWYFILDTCIHVKKKGSGSEICLLMNYPLSSCPKSKVTILNEVGHVIVSKKRRESMSDSMFRPGTF